MYPKVTEELLDYFGMETIVKVLNENPSAKGNFYGYMAEEFLRRELQTLNGVISVTKIPDQHVRKGDLVIVFDDGTEYTIEVKMIRSQGMKYDYVHGGIQGTVSVKSSDAKIIPGTEKRTCSLSYGSFDILAVAYLEDEKWKFRFMRESRIPPSPEFPGRMTTSFVLNTQNTLFLYPSVFNAIFDIS